MTKEFYNGLMENLRGQPILAAFVGLVFMFMVGGGGGAIIILRDEHTSNAGLIIAGLFLGVLLIFLALVAMLLRNAKTAVPDGERNQSGLERRLPDRRIKALSDAIDQMKRIVQAQWVKSDLQFSLTITSISGDSANAKLGLSASFKVINVTDDRVLFPFLTEVEVDVGCAKTLNGHLSVRNTESDTLTHDLDIKLNQVAPTLRRHRHPPTTLEAGCEYLFHWTVEEYTVPLPYCEYWASAHPVINVQVSVKSSDSAIGASAIVYRPIDQGIDEEPVIEQELMAWRAHGVFLPYQGILLKVFRTSMEHS